MARTYLHLPTAYFSDVTVEEVIVPHSDMLRSSETRNRIRASKIRDIVGVTSQIFEAHLRFPVSVVISTLGFGKMILTLQLYARHRELASGHVLEQILEYALLDALQGMEYPNPNRPSPAPVFCIGGSMKTFH